MTVKQFDTICLKLDNLNKLYASLTNKIATIESLVKGLSDKTLVVTTLDQDIEKLKIDVAALIDEKEA